MAEDLSGWMVAQGWALAYRHYSTAYVDEEDAAHAAQLGIWRRRVQGAVGLATRTAMDLMASF